MSSRTAVVPDDTHLDRYLEYPRRAHPQMKAVFVEAMENGVVMHVQHALPSKCIFQRTEIAGTTTSPSSMRNPGGQNERPPA